MKWNRINESEQSTGKINDVYDVYKLMCDDIRKLLTDVENNPSKYGIDNMSEYFSKCISSINKFIDNDGILDVGRKEYEQHVGQYYNDLYQYADDCLNEITGYIHNCQEFYEISNQEENFLSDLDSAINVNILEYKTTRNRLPKPKHKYTYTIGFWHYDEEQGEILAIDEKEARQLIINEYQDDDRYDYKEYEIVDIKPS